MNRARPRGSPSSLLLLTLLLLPAAALAQEPDNELRPNPGGRILKGHVLLYPVLAQSAVVSTHVGIREGVASFKADQVPLSTLGPRDTSVTGLQQMLDLSIRFTPWLAAYIEAQGQALVGTNTITLLRRGSAFETSADGGLALRVLRNERSGSQLTVRGWGGLASGTDVTLLPLLASLRNAPGRTLESLIEGGGEDFLVVPTSEYSFGLGVYFAQAFSKAFSLQASSTARRTERTESPFDVVLNSNIEEDLRVFRWHNAVALTYDFAAHGAPVAVLGEYMFALGNRSGGVTSLLLSDDIQSSTVALGLYYSGRPNLQLGLTGAMLLNGEPLQGLTPEGVPAESEKPTLSYTQLILRYIW